jgi:hypothetical protein
MEIVGGELDRRISKVITTQSVLGTDSSLAHSLWTRGFRRTSFFSTLGHGIPLLGEYSAVNVVDVLRHHTEPQVKGVPLPIALNWYNLGYGTFVMMEYVLNRTQLDTGGRIRPLWLETALVATSLDLLVDPSGQEIGLWESNSDGAYTTELEGPNGRHGVPLLDFAGWLGSAAGVTLAYRVSNLVITVLVMPSRQQLAARKWGVQRRCCYCPTTFQRRYGR